MAPVFKGMKATIYWYSTEMVMAASLIIGYILGLVWIKYDLPVPKPFQKKKDKPKGNKTTSEFTQNLFNLKDVAQLSFAERTGIAYDVIRGVTAAPPVITTAIPDI